MPRRRSKAPGSSNAQKPQKKPSTNDVKKRGGDGRGEALSLSSDDRLGFAVLSTVTAAAYSPVVHADFVWDDVIFSESPLVHSWGGLYDFWFRPSRLETEIHYWPVTYTTFWLEYRLWGSNPAGCHVVNVVLHVANCCLLRMLLRRVGAPDNVAWLAAFVFALHPTRVESVAWCIERKDVLSGMFYVLALLYHPSVGPKAVTESSPATMTAATWTSLGFYVLGMLSKSIVVSLPVVLLLIPWARRGAPSRMDALRAAPFFVVGVAMALVDVRMARAGEPVDFGFTLSQRILIASRALCFYLWQLVWPTDLMVVYPKWDLGEDGWIWAGCFLLVAATSVGALYTLVKSRPDDVDCKEGSQRQLMLRVLAAAFVSFGATLFPVLCILDYGYMAYSYVADRFGYLAGIAPISLFAIAFAAACGRLSRPSSAMRPNGALIVAGSVLLAILATMTYRQASIYETGESFYSHIVGLNPRAKSMWTNLGNEYMRSDRNSKAVECYEKSLLHDPSQEKLYTNYGIVLRKLGRTEEAVEMLERGLEVLTKTSVKSRAKHLNELGNVMSEQRRYDEAVSYFRRALELRPDYAIGWNNLANDLFRGGEAEEAVSAYRRAVEINPNYSNARLNCAFVLGTLKRYDEQIDQLQELLKREPGNKKAKEQLDAAVAKAR